jgi:2'-5' RNA ligase
MNAAGDPRRRALRAFFALWPDAEVRAALAERTKAAVGIAGGRIPRADNLHLTLVFLGSTPQDRVPALAAAMDAIALPPFTFTLDKCGWFRQNGIAWLGSETVPDVLVDLHAALARASSRLGFSLDVRPYVPHLTLARDVRKGLPPRSIAPVAWDVSSFALVASDLTPEGPRYRIVHETALQTLGARDAYRPASQPAA